MVSGGAHPSKSPPFKTGEAKIKGQRSKSQKIRIINRQEPEIYEVQATGRVQKSWKTKLKCRKHSKQ